MSNDFAVKKPKYSALNQNNKKHNVLKWKDYLSILPILVLICLFLIAPLLWVIINAFRDGTGVFSLHNIKEIFMNDFYLQSMGISIKISIYSSIIGLIIGLQGAFSLYALRNTVVGKILVPLNSLLSNFTGVPLAFAMMIVLGNSGVLNIVAQSLGFNELLDIYSNTGILISYIYFQIPLAILLLYPAIESIKIEWKESAYLMGSNSYYYFVKIVIPTLMPALLGTFIILLANALGAYATAYALTSGSLNILPIRIASLIAGNLFLDPNLAAALALVLLFMMLIATIVQQYLLKKYKVK